MTAKPRVALFIDAENASAKHLPEYLALCRTLGKPAIARCYGGAASLKKWEKAIAEFHIMPMLTPPSANKENASDFALTIDAVSLLHRGLFDHAVIASSDADFVQLAIHIRELGRGIDVIGEAKGAAAFQSAIDDVYKIVPPATKTAPAPSPQTQIRKRELLHTFERLSKLGRVTLATYGKVFKQDHPAIDLGKGKLKKVLLSIGLEVNDKQEVSRVSLST